MDKRFVDMLENIGYINKDGERIKGTAALLHFLHMPVSEFDPKCTELRRRYVQRLPNI
ncbi:MAG: hypothetical protein NC078_11870 [Ruminococcus sp.]|nr:hypothetical protein [Ruminococcus sp.]